MNRCAVIATHHKTGTKWMNSTFTAICRALDIPFVNADRDGIPRRDEAKPPYVLFSPHAKFGKSRWLLENPEHRVFHVIRDPRDVIISAMHYHRVSKEHWLHVAREEFGGRTYQQQLNSLPDDRQRYLFEMNRSAKTVIKAMRRWNYGRPTSIECKYEDLIVDTEMSLFTDVVRHLGFSDDELERCREQFWRMSIFGDKAARKGKVTHIRSGDAKQWQLVFDRGLALDFIENFGTVLVRLGYETDHSWIDTLAQREIADDRSGAVAAP